MQYAISLKNERVFNAINTVSDLIIYKAFIEPIFDNKILIVLIEGKSGEGKSLTSVGLAERIEIMLSKVLGSDYRFDPNKQVVYSPLDYNNVMSDWLNSNYGTCVIEELRQLVSAKNWRKLLSQAIAEANATLRDIKINNCGHCGILIFNTQDMGDITKDIRKTINIDMTLHRTDRVNAHIYEFWYDRKNVEHPTTRLKKLRLDFGSEKEFAIDLIEFDQPSRDIIKIFREKSIAAKVKFLERKRKQILREINKELGQLSFKDELNIPETFEMVHRMINVHKGHIKISPENKQIIMKMYNMGRFEFNNHFMPDLMEVMKSKALLQKSEGENEDGIREEGTDE